LRSPRDAATLRRERLERSKSTLAAQDSGSQRPKVHRP